MRLSVTELEAYRWYRDQEDATLEALLAQLRKESAPTKAMLAGSAWHKVLELADWPGDGDLDVVEQDGFTFRIVGDIELCLPEVRELKGEFELTTPSGPVTLVGIVDGMDHAGIHDYKLTARFDAEKYADSYQWRCYLVMFGGQQFVYDIFVGREEARTGDWLIGEYNRMPFYAYPNLREDVQREVNEFAAFVAAYLPERLTPPQPQQPALAGA